MEDYSDLKGTEFDFISASGAKASCFLAEIDETDLTVKGNWMSDPEDKAPQDIICINRKDKKNDYFSDEAFRKAYYDYVISAIKKGVYDVRDRMKVLEHHSDDGISSQTGPCAFG